MIKITTKGSKKYVTSTFFDDIKVLKKSEFETDYRDLYRNTTFNVEKLKLQFVCAKITTFKKGCAELTNWVNSQSNAQLNDVYTVYGGRDYVEEEREPVLIDGKYVFLNPEGKAEQLEISDPDND